MESPLFGGGRESASAKQQSQYLMLGMVVLEMNLVIMSFTLFTVNLRKGSDQNSDLRAPGSFEPKQKQILKLFMFPILIVPVPSVGANT